METKTIKISEENYRWLSSVAGELQSAKGKPVSLDAALTFIHRQKNIMKLAGKSTRTDEEIKEANNVIKRGWETWNKKYV